LICGKSLAGAGRVFFGFVFVFGFGFGFGLSWGMEREARGRRLSLLASLRA
jgi:hypothetical protein